MTAADWNLWWMWRDAAGWMVKMEAAGSVIVGVAEGDLGRPLCTCCRFVMETMVVVEAVVAVVIWHRWRRHCYGRLLASAGWMGAACGRVADRRWRWKEMRVLAVDGPDAGRKDGGSAAGDGRTLVVEAVWSSGLRALLDRDEDADRWKDAAIWDFWDVGTGVVVDGGEGAAVVVAAALSPSTGYLAVGSCWSWGKWGTAAGKMEYHCMVLRQ
ncbi:hypothetical protein ACLOJK_029908, partial [Asimina triloba]